MKWPCGVINLSNIQIVLLKMTSTFHRLGRLVFKEINQYGSIPPFKGSLIHRSVRQKIHPVWDGVGKDPFYLFLDAVDDSHPSVFVFFVSF
jgi:hypothetical protein